MALASAAICACTYLRLWHQLLILAGALLAGAHTLL
jgi:hypothetical protein